MLYMCEVIKLTIYLKKSVMNVKLFMIIFYRNLTPFPSWPWLVRLRFRPILLLKDRGRPLALVETEKEPPDRCSWPNWVRNRLFLSQILLISFSSRAIASLAIWPSVYTTDCAALLSRANTAHRWDSISSTPIRRRVSSNSARCNLWYSRVRANSTIPFIRRMVKWT